MSAVRIALRFTSPQGRALLATATMPWSSPWLPREGEVINAKLTDVVRVIEVEHDGQQVTLWVRYDTPTPIAAAEVELDMTGAGMLAVSASDLFLAPPLPRR